MHCKSILEYDISNKMLNKNFNFYKCKKGDRKKCTFVTLKKTVLIEGDTLNLVKIGNNEKDIIIYIIYIIVFRYFWSEQI